MFVEATLLCGRLGYLKRGKAWSPFAIKVRGASASEMLLHLSSVVSFLKQ
jgi:hypothetical protein